MLKNKTILLCQSEPQIRTFINSTLKQQLNAERIIVTDNKAEALKVAKSPQNVHSLDLIISNWSIENDSGLELLKALRSDSTIPKIPFILVSPRNDKESILVAMEAGVTQYMVMPLSAATLIHTIKKALGIKDKRAMPRIDVKSQLKVGIKFPSMDIYASKMKNLSQTGCMVSSPLFEHGIKGVYEKVTLNIQIWGKSTIVQAEIVRMEEDLDNPPPKDFMNVGFQFTSYSNEDRDRLIKFLSSEVKKTTNSAD